MTDLVPYYLQVEPNKECSDCDVEYTCFTCEAEQVRNKYPNAVYTDDCQWTLKESEQWTLTTNWDSLMTDDTAIPPH